jgi:tetratricopeptide (TPR) repeat protein
MNDVTVSRGPPLQAAQSMTRPLPGTQLLGRYTALTWLGEGGMGLVVAAFDDRLNRRVALKLLPKGADSESEARLVREARAMGRLRHPNVVAVYDSGQLDEGTLFIAMEYVEGQTLQAWCEASEREWPEILKTYCQAAVGLDAAHQAGLIHRDFKPLNVLVGKDGGVRVTDFGIARSGSPEEHQVTAGMGEVWTTPLTRAGQVVGTPKYMAPELLKGRGADVRSDVFAFCVALYEALYRQPAFKGTTPKARYEAKVQGHTGGLPERSAVPAWLGHAVLRGLSPIPAQRPASIRQLLQTLEPPTRKRKKLGVLAAACMVALTGGWAFKAKSDTGCQSVGLRLEKAWGENVQRKVSAVMLSTHAAGAQETVSRVQSVFDAYAASWVKMSTEVCLATGTGASKVNVLREACLERKRRQFQNLTELLSEKPDVDLVSKAVSAAQALAPVEACADERALIARVPPPELPELRAQVELLERRVGRLETLEQAGKHQLGLVESPELLRATEATHHAPLYAQALYTVASIEDRSGQLAAAENRVRMAIPLAAEAGDALTVAHGWLLLHRLLRRQGRFSEAQALSLPMEASLEQSGDALAKASAVSAQGTIAYELGRPAEALEKYHQALTIREKFLGPDHNEVARLLNNIGMVLAELGNHREALKYDHRALLIYEQNYGPNHIGVARALSSTGTVLVEMSEFAEALTLFERSLRIQKSVFGEVHPVVADTYNDIGDVQLAQGRCGDALKSHLQAWAIHRKSLGEKNFNVGYSLNKVGKAWLCSNETARAFECFQQSLAILEVAFGSDHPERAVPMMGLGRVLTSRQDYVGALAWYERALSLQERVLGPTHPKVTETLMGMGELFVAQRQVERALPHLERALTQAKSNQQRAEAKLTLAQALWLKPKSRGRAVTLANDSLQWWQASHHPQEIRVAEWLATHQLSPRAGISDSFPR